MGILHIFFFYLYSKPNLLLFNDRLIIHGYPSKGEILLNDVVRVIVGYRIPVGLIPKNRTYCLNNMYTRNDKIFIKLNRRVPFLLPLGRTKFVDEIVIDVLDPDKLAWNLGMRNPAIVFWAIPKEIEVTRPPTTLAEVRAQI